ncbi:hypothetical protein ACQEU3_40170 [Spirillospora sp. CA-253888]
MDELTKVADLLTAEHPPTEQKIAQGRRRLMNEASRARSWHPRRSAPSSAKPSRWRLALVSMTTMLAIGAGGWGFYAWQTRPLYHPEPLAGQTGPAASFLLAAADGKARHATSGRHWYLRMINGQSVPVKSPIRPGVRYIVEARRPTYQLAQDVGSRVARPPTYNWDGDEVTVRPASQADEVAWIDDGRPDAQTLGVDAPETQRGPDPEEGGYFDIGTADARRLPANPSELRAWILNYATKFDHRKLENPDAYLFVYAPLLLAELPVSDHVRIATYKIMASLKGVRMVTATDPTGKPGKAVSMRQTTRELGTIDWQLFIDPSTGRLTSSQAVIVAPGAKNGDLRVGTRQFFQVVEKAEWSDAAAKTLLPESVWNENWEPPID